MTKREGTLSNTELEDALEIFQDESDRACAVLGAAHIDYLLAKAILKALPNGQELAKRLLDAPNAPLHSFSARIDIAHAMGLPVDKEFFSPDRRPFKVAHDGAPLTSLFA